MKNERRSGYGKRRLTISAIFPFASFLSLCSLFGPVEIVEILEMRKGKIIKSFEQMAAPSRPTGTNFDKFDSFLANVLWNTSLFGVLVEILRIGGKVVIDSTFRVNDFFFDYGFVILFFLNIIFIFTLISYVSFYMKRK